jgi:uncharacterized membrane protein
MNIQKDINSLLDAGVISQDIAAKIQDYYQSKKQKSSGMLFTIFAVLGALLIGLGIILILAHNWDSLSVSTRTIFAFVPLLTGQFLCVYTILKKRDSSRWKESTSSFLIMAIGASIALVSQIYHITGGMGSFLLTWLLLSLPLIYLMRSSLASILYFFLLTYYVSESILWFSYEALVYLILVLLALPHYYFLLKSETERLFATVHSWIIPISIVIALPFFSGHADELMPIIYLSLFALFLSISRLKFFNEQGVSKAFTVLGSLGTIICLISLSFFDLWDYILPRYIEENIFALPQFYIAMSITAFALIALLLQIRENKMKQLRLEHIAFLIILPLFFFIKSANIGLVLINIIVLPIGVFTIVRGSKTNSLAILNYGLITISALILCRFFDTDLDFVLRGLIFIILGISFFICNVWMLKRRRNEK